MKTHATLILFLAGSALWAQTTDHIFIASGGGEHFPDSTVTGAPYSATVTTTSTQTLSDGTKITRKIEAQLARDSQGRTRREENSDAVGPWSTNEKAHMVLIRDPVSQAAYNLQPDEKTAVKLPMAGAIAAAKIVADGGPTSIGIAFDERRVTPDQVRTFTVDGGRINVVTGPNEGGQVEDLGTQVIEGVNVKGKRETRTIPAGKIGNDRPIQIVSETWYSDELQMVIQSKHSDPRVGESNYTLTNISRNEPDPSLFQIPAGYTVKEERPEIRRR